MTRFAMSILLAIAMANGAVATAQVAPDARRTDELMRKSGLWNQVGQMQAQVKAGAAQARDQAKAKGGPAGMTDAEAARLDAAMDAAFAPDRLRKAVAGQLAKELSAKDEDEVLAWLSSDLGARITKLEEDSGEVESLLTSEREARKHLASLPPERVQRLERFAKATRAGEANAAVLINITTAVVYGAALATPPSDTSGVPALRARLESQRPQMVAAFTQHAIAQFAYIYRTLSDEEIDRYVDFAETPTGRKYHEATIKALEDVITHASLDMGREIGRAMPTQPRRSS